MTLKGAPEGHNIGMDTGVNTNIMEIGIGRLL